MFAVRKDLQMRSDWLGMTKVKWPLGRSPAQALLASPRADEIALTLEDLVEL